MDSINPLIVLCSWLPIRYVSALAHELGHALLGRAVGFVATSCGLSLQFISGSSGPARSRW
jgi:hypothetical protein